MYVLPFAAAIIYNLLIKTFFLNLLHKLKCQFYNYFEHQRALYYTNY